MLGFCDEVVVLAGKDKGKKGKIVKVIPDIRKVVVTDINKYKKHQKPGNNEPGGIIEKDMPLHVSNVAFLDPDSSSGTRVGYSFNKDGKQTCGVLTKIDLMDKNSSVENYLKKKLDSHLNLLK